MDSQERFYPESRFGGYTDIDGTVVFYGRINALLEPSFSVLDVGCGRGEYVDDPVPFRRNLRVMKGKVATVVGIDVDQAAEENPFLDEFHLMRGSSWPVADNSMDLIVCDWVLEHVDNPDTFFAEACRVLKHGGLLCIRTTNLWSYLGLAASLIPNKYHSAVTAAVQDERKEEDVFPTLYKCNSLAKVRRAMKRSGFDHVAYGYEAEPAYFAFSRIAYFLGVIHQRLSPRFLKPTLHAFGRIQKAGG